jgi:steroid delta-isomerase
MKLTDMPRGSDSLEGASDERKDNRVTERALPSADDIKATIERYLRAIEARDIPAIVSQFAEDALFENPAGIGVVYRGRDAIRQYFEINAADPRTMRLGTVRVSGDTAAFVVQISATSPGATRQVEMIDVVTFDEHARISSLCAVWSPTDVRTV